jgi:hypothetical protein
MREQTQLSAQSDELAAGPRIAGPLFFLKSAILSSDAKCNTPAD